jgi:hypothetical protein
MRAETGSNGISGAIAPLPAVPSDDDPPPDPACDDFEGAGDTSSDPVQAIATALETTTATAHPGIGFDDDIEPLLNTRRRFV